MSTVYTSFYRAKYYLLLAFLALTTGIVAFAASARSERTSQVQTVRIFDFPEIRLYVGTDADLAITDEFGTPMMFPALFGDLESKLIVAASPASTDQLETEPGAVPNKLILDQNFPNPFNPTTTIRYGLPTSTKVKLTVHTLLGNQIRVLVDQSQDPGNYLYDFSAQDLPSGAYFYRLQTDLGTITRRMIVSK